MRRWRGARVLWRCRAAAIATSLLEVAGTAGADTQLGSLGAPAGAADLYRVTCSDSGSGPPVSLTIAIRDTLPAAAPLVSALAQRGLLATNTTDAVDGDAPSSPTVAIDGGAGSYDVLVYKSASGAETYSLVFHCMTGPNGTGTHTGTEITTRQDDAPAPPPP